MIIIPTFSRRAGAQGYRDARDEGLVYVDALRPAPAHDAPLRWQALPGGETALAAEVRFGPDEAAARAFAIGGARPVPMPWQVSPVFAWASDGERVQILARGRTSGIGAHNAVLSATVQGALLGAPVAIAAELQAVGRLSGASLEGAGEGATARALLPHAPLGERARWGLTLGEALQLWLRELLNARVLSLRAEATALSLDGVEDLRAIALAEWASRAARAWFPGLASLAMPAALAGAPAGRDPELALRWRAGDVVPVRAVRALVAGDDGQREARPP